MTLFCLVFPFFLFLHVCCFINVALSSSALLSFVGACFAFSCWCCRLDERLGKGGGGGQDDEERLFASDAGSWYTVSDVDCSKDSSDDGNDDVDDDSTTSVDGSDDDDDDDSGDGSNSNNVSSSEGVEDGFTLQRCRRRVRNVIVSDTDSDNSGA